MNLHIDGNIKTRKLDGCDSDRFNFVLIVSHRHTARKKDPLSSKIFPNIFPTEEKPFDSTAFFLSFANYSCKTPNFLISNANMDFFCLCFFVVFAGIHWRHIFSLPWMATPEVHGVMISKIIWRFSRHLFSFPLSWTPCAKVSDSRRL